MTSLPLYGLFFASLTVSFLVLFATRQLEGNSWRRNLSSAAVLFYLVTHLVALAVVEGYGEKYPLLFRFGFPFELGAISIVYLYVRSLTEEHFSFRKIHPVHALPFLFGWAWYFAFLLFAGELYFQWSSEFLLEKYYRVIVGLFIFLPYSIAVFCRVRDFERRARNELSSIQDLHLPWLRFLVLLSIAAGSFTLMDIVTGPNKTLWMLKPIFPTFGLMGLVYYGLRCSPFFQAIPEPIETKPGSLSDTEMDRMRTLILDTLERDKIYLRPQLRLSDLAAAVQSKPYLVTEVIHRGLKTNFFDLVNGYRLDHARNMLTEKKSAHLSILGIGLESGFNSKSTFNDLFRRRFGQPPSAFRNPPGN